jgi:hypothetical protein
VGTPIRARSILISRIEGLGILVLGCELDLEGVPLHLPDLLSISANASGARSARRPMPSRMQWRATHPPRQLTKREFAELDFDVA